jgi:hypothetical protein
MSEKKWGCLKSTAVGCGAVIVLAVALPLVLAMMMMAPFQNAIDDRAAIDEQYGTQESFVPPASGAPEPARIEVFLSVRRSLAPISSDIEEAEKQVARLESIEDQDNVTTRQALRQAFATSRSMLGVGPLIGRFYEVRNNSLLEAEMGLGEFTYLFVTAYHQRLFEPPRESQLFGPGPVNPRVREAVRLMLQNQLEALESGGAESTAIDEVRAEVEAMNADRSRLPWQDGLPRVVADAYEPYQGRLDALYFPAAAPLELMINEKRGLAIEGN